MDYIDDEKEVIEWGCDGEKVSVEKNGPVFDPEKVRVFIGGVEVKGMDGAHHYSNGSMETVVADWYLPNRESFLKFVKTDKYKKVIEEGGAVRIRYEHPKADEMPESNDDICRSPLRVVRDGDGE